MVKYDVNIFLKKDIIENKNITSEGILAYVGLVIMSENKISRIYTSVAGIEFALKVDFEKEDRYFKEKIKRGLLNLVENNLIHIVSKKEDFKPNEIIAIRLLDFTIDTKNEYFVMVNITDILEIARYEEKKFENEKLLRYYLVVLGTINNKSKIGYTTIEVLSDKAQVGETTVKTKYNPLLEKLRLIYISRSDIGIKYNTGEIRRISNTYGRYGDKDEIIRQAEEFKSQIVHSNFANTITGDRARSIKQKYNYFIKKMNEGYTPTKNEIDEMNGSIELYNMKYKYDTEIVELQKIQYTYQV